MPLMWTMTGNKGVMVLPRPWHCVWQQQQIVTAVDVAEVTCIPQEGKCTHTTLTRMKFTGIHGIGVFLCC